MKISKTWAAFVAALAMGMSACGTMCKEKPVPEPVSGVVGESAVTATAKVKAVNQKTRQVTLQRSDGSVMKFVAGEEVRNLPQVHVGDEVTVTYHESLAYEVRPAGTAAPGTSVAAGAARAPEGERPAGVVGQSVTVTATIAAIDKKIPSVTLQTADGEKAEYRVRDPQKLERVKVGDLVELTYTEAVAISVNAAKK